MAGKIALIAGGTGGLGRAASLAFLEQGSKVAVTYRRREGWETLQNAAGASKEHLQGYALDVTDETAVGDLIQNILEKHGRLDILINTVGAYAGGVKLWEVDA